MNRLIDWHHGFLATMFGRDLLAEDPTDVDDVADRPADHLDHPTYLRRGIVIHGMAQPAAVRAGSGLVRRPS